MNTIEGQLVATNMKVAILVARFNGFITESLLEGALDALKRHGVGLDAVDVIRVPGAYELPLAAKGSAKSGRYDAIIALGAVVRGSTPHFDYVAGECAKGLSQIALQAEIPVAFGVLTTDTLEQAIERAGTKAGNKGAEAALTAIEMVDVLRQLSALGPQYS